MSQGFFDKSRLLLSRLALGCLLAVLLFTRSAWEGCRFPVAEWLFLSGCVLAALGAMGRLWCALYIAGRKSRELITSGPYSISRNPLYFFSAMGAIGVGLASETISVPMLIGAAFAAYYPMVIRAEELKLASRHDAEYEAYRLRTPRFFPKWSLLQEHEEYATNPVKFRKSILSALWFVWFIGILELIEGMHEMGVLKELFRLY